MNEWKDKIKQEQLRKRELAKQENKALMAVEELHAEEQERLRRGWEEFGRQMFNQWRKLIHIKWKMKTILNWIWARK